MLPKPGGELRGKLPHRRCRLRAWKALPRAPPRGIWHPDTQTLQALWVFLGFVSKLLYTSTPKHSSSLRAEQPHSKPLHRTRVKKNPKTSPLPSLPLLRQKPPRPLPVPGRRRAGPAGPRRSPPRPAPVTLCRNTPTNTPFFPPQYPPAAAAPARQRVLLARPGRRQRGGE